MKFRFGFHLILLLLSIYSYGQDIILSGTAIDYANFNVPVKYVFNPITGNTKIVDTLSIDKNGEFSLELNFEELTWIQLDLGIYQCVMLVMPGHEYRVSLPPRRDKTESEIRSMFFEPYIIHLRLINDRIINIDEIIEESMDINSRIFNFDTLVFRINNDQLEARNEKRPFEVDSMIVAVENRYSLDSCRYFSNYRRYRYGLVQMNSGKKSLLDIYTDYLSVDFPEIHNPAYMDLFSKMYEKFFYYFSRTPQGKNLNHIVNQQQSLKALRNELRKHNSIPNDTIADLVIMKEVSESFYRDFYYKKALLMLLDSIIADPNIPEYKIIAEDIHDKLTNLMIGTKPPEFSLMNESGQRITPQDFKGKYLLVMFCTPDNYSCMKEYPFLNALHEKHGDYLEIVTVMITESIQNMNEFMKNNRYNWVSLFYENSEEVLRAYNIRAYPTCYLIGPDGLLIQSPATLPTEGLEQQLFRIMRSRGDL